MNSHALQVIAVTVSIAFLFEGLSPFAKAATVPFPDTAASWYGYREAIRELRDEGVISGYEDGTFGPKKEINRAEFIKLLFAAKSDSEPAGSECFVDVPADAWYGPYVCAAKRRGIVHGYRDGTFRAEQPVNIAEAIKMITLAYGRTVTTAEASEWYEPYTESLDRDGILSRSSYLPWDELTRERAADVIHRVVLFEEEKVASNRSPGCGETIIQSSLTLQVQGQERTFLLTSPRRYTQTKAHPLIIAFHGRTNSNEQVRKYYGFDKAATEFFIAYPAAISNGKSYSWSDVSSTATMPRDLEFFDEMIEHIAERYCIDMDRIYLAGHSLGAWVASGIACVRGGVVRGVATVGGAAVLPNCTGPVAAMIINNPKDASSPQKTAEQMRDQRLQQNSCLVQTAAADPKSLSCITYPKCDGGNVVTFCPHTIDTERDGTYYPHVWPPGAGQAITEFFRQLD